MNTSGECRHSCLIPVSWKKAFSLKVLGMIIISAFFLSCSLSGCCYLAAKSCSGLWESIDCSPLYSLVHGICQARILKRVATSQSRGSSWLRDQAHTSYIGRWTLYHWATQEATLGYCCSVAQSCQTLCDPMDCSMPGSRVLHHLPEFAHTHVRWMPSNHLCNHVLLLPSIFPSIRVFSTESSHQVTKILELQLQHQPYQWIFSIE